MPLQCESEGCGERAAMKRPKTGSALCQPCFFKAFEDEVHQTIIKAPGLFKKGEYVAIAASGGKDSTVLAHVMKLLNEKYEYGLKLVLLSVDEGITGYRDDSLETVKRNEIQYDIPLKILSYKDLYGWTMDEIVREVGRKNNCTFCGVFRRQALDRGAVMLGVDKIVTGHNADDVGETVLMNLLRGDVARLRRCTAITTGADGALPRCKPFKYTYEKEIVMYAYYKKLDYFSTECTYSPNAYRGHVRTLIKDLEKIRPSSIIDIIHSGESLGIREGVKMPTQGTCDKCGYISSQAICKACVMLEGLNKGLPKLGIGKSSKVKEKLREINGEKKGECCGGGGDGCGSRQGKRSLNKIKKAKDRKARMMNNGFVTPSSDLLEDDRISISSSIITQESLDFDDDDNAGALFPGELLGCGGFIQEEEDEDSEIIMNKSSSSNIDIENLGEILKVNLVGNNVKK